MPKKSNKKTFNKNDKRVRNNKKENPFSILKNLQLN